MTQREKLQRWKPSKGGNKGDQERIKNSPWQCCILIRSQGWGGGRTPVRQNKTPRWGDCLMTDQPGSPGFSSSQALQTENLQEIGFLASGLSLLHFESPSGCHCFLCPTGDPLREVLIFSPVTHTQEPGAPPLLAAIVVTLIHRRPEHKYPGSKDVQSELKSSCPGCLSEDPLADFLDFGSRCFRAWDLTSC